MIPVKQWVIEEAERLNTTTRAIEARITRRRYVGHKRVRIPGKGMWVIEPGVYQPASRGNLKDFVVAEAMRYGVTLRTIYSRIYRGNYRGMIMKKAKGRIAWVIEPGKYETHYRRVCNTCVDGNTFGVHTNSGLNK